jgi:hypothetical protein
MAELTQAASAIVRYADSHTTISTTLQPAPDHGVRAIATVASAR